jgi:hypothetical protein
MRRKQRLPRVAVLPVALLFLELILGSLSSTTTASAFLFSQAGQLSHSHRKVASPTTCLQRHASEGTSSNEIKQNFLDTSVPGPSLATKPDYEKTAIGPLGRWMDLLFLRVFRRKLAGHVGGADSSRNVTDFMGIIDLAAAMNRRFSQGKIHSAAQQVLRELFPSWMPGSYAVLFSKPFPAFSSRMNAWATKVAGTWLMGECEINDVVVDGGEVGEGQGLLVKRCRFLEESGCASICVNSCKIPTQNFFAQDMGLPLTMEPNYETFECQFSFGRTPDSSTELDAKSTPCLSRCPTFGSLRLQHQDDSSFPFTSAQQQVATTAPSPCSMMGE